MKIDINALVLVILDKVVRRFIMELFRGNKESFNVSMSDFLTSWNNIARDLLLCCLKSLDLTYFILIDKKLYKQIYLNTVPNSEIK